MKPKDKNLDSAGELSLEKQREALSQIKASKPAVAPGNKDSSKKPEKQLKPKKPEDIWIQKFKESEKEYLYLKAEFENFKQRTLQEKHKLIRYEGERFISSLAEEFLDDLDRAVLSSKTNQSLEDLQKGLKMILKKLELLFEKFGIEVLDPKGQPFDPSYQEALSYVKAPDLPENQVVETYKKAYKLHDKLIRPAQVVLSKKTNSDKE